MTRIYIHTDYITLSQFLKFSGVVETGGEAGEEIRAGNILLNGEPCTVKGKKLYGGEVITVYGEDYQVVKP